MWDIIFAVTIVVMLLIGVSQSRLGRETDGPHIWNPNDPEMDCPTCLIEGRETCRMATGPQQTKLEDYNE